MNRNLMPQKSLLENPEEISIEGKTYRVQCQLDNRYLMEISDIYIQREWLRLYEKIIQEVAKIGIGRQDYFVLKITPIVREIPQIGSILYIDAEINAVQYKEVVIPAPHFEDFPITFSYLFKQWKVEAKYNIKHWWEGIFK